MALRKEITTRITDLLQQNPQGLSITEIVKSGGINRNTAGRYLDNLLVTGQVEMRHFGMAKIYSLSRRLPVSSVLAISSELVMQLDASLRIVFLNQPFVNLLGTTEKELTGKNIEFSKIPLYFDETFPTILEWIHNGLSGTEFRGEITVPSKKKIFYCRIAPTVFNHGQKGVSILFDDITLQKQGEHLLRESEARLRSIIRVAPIGIGLVASRTFLEVNDRVCRMTGYSEEELIGKSVRILYQTQEEYDRVGDLKYREMYRTGTGSIETTWLRKDGKTLDVLLSSTPLDPDHPEAGITFTALDITEQRMADRALRESEDRYRSLAEASQDLIFVIDREDRVLYINQKAADYLKKPAAAVTGHPRNTHFPVDISDRQYQALQHVFASGQMVRSESPMDFLGEIRWFDHALVPILDADGTVASVLGVSRDITKRIAAEQEQRQNERNNRFIAEHCVDIIHRLSPDCVCTYTSPSVTTLLGYTEEDVLGKPVLSMIHPDDLPGVVKDIAAIRDSRQDTVMSTFRFRHKDGHYLRFESTTRIVRDVSGHVKEFLSISRDISGRKTKPPAES